jgi:hypothetical protein
VQVNTTSRDPARAPRTGSGTAGRRPLFGRPDYFVWLPAAALLLDAAVVATIGASLSLGLALVAVAVVLVVFESWVNR